MRTAPSDRRLLKSCFFVTSSDMWYLSIWILIGRCEMNGKSQVGHLWSQSYSCVTVVLLFKLGNFLGLQITPRFPHCIQRSFPFPFNQVPAYTDRFFAFQDLLKLFQKKFIYICPVVWAVPTVHSWGRRGSYSLSVDRRVYIVLMLSVGSFPNPVLFSNMLLLGFCNLDCHFSIIFRTFRYAR